MDYRIRNSEYIPLKLQLSVMDEYYPNSLKGDIAATAKLFEVYNSYIALYGHELSMNCGLCIGKVQNAFKIIIDHWKQS